MYLLDTDIIIWVLRKNSDVVEAVSRTKDRGVTAISVVTITEIYQNIFPSEIENTEEYIHRHIIYPVTEGIAKKAGMYWNEFSKKFTRLSGFDCMIAATAREHELTLITLNTRHFPMTDIRVIDPVMKKRGV